jgi:16S rRNA (cytosine967-C5)-methyltransferase
MRIGAYELLFLGTAPHAAVGEAVGLVKQVDHGRASGYVNAVLRALSRKPARPAPPPLEADPAGHVAIAEALPRWLAEEWVAWLGAPEALALAAAMNGPAPLTLRSERRDDLVDRLRMNGVDASPALRSPDGVRIGGGSVASVARAAAGIPFQVQDEAAQLVTLLAAEGLRGKVARVLDACAAPGGKAFHLADLLAQGSEIVAIELHPRKADALREEAQRRVYPGLKVICADAAEPIPGLDEGSFDAVLVDAPCAGLGTLRRHPELKLRRVPEDLPRFAAMQRPILENCARYAKPGAPIVYSVCSLSRDEGPRLVEGLLAKGFARSPAPAGFPADVLTAEGDLLTLPSRHGADGFYAARLTRP